MHVVSSIAWYPASIKVSKSDRVVEAGYQTFCCLTMPGYIKHVQGIILFALHVQAKPTAADVRI